MPELPEVENVRLGLASIVGVPIERARVARRDVVRDRCERRRGTLDPADLLAGAPIQTTRRHGKQLAILGPDGHAVLIHLGMSGQLLVLDPGQRVQGGHAHVVWSLADGRRLVFRDPRRFGGVWLIPDEEALEARWALLGPDALRASPGDLRERLGGSDRSLKPALLDQRTLAGVGNIYADEALFRARIRPDRPCRSLCRDEWTRVASSVRRVLRDGIRAGGSTLRDYRRPDGTAGRGIDGHRVYGRAGQPCVRCGQVLASAAIAQRTTVWCDACQE